MTCVILVNAYLRTVELADQHSCVSIRFFFSAIDGNTAATIVSNPPGTPVIGSANTYDYIGSANTYDYPILSSVILTCAVYPMPSESVTYQWNTEGCYARDDNKRWCFANGQTTQSVNGSNLMAKDAGAITCTATIGGVDYTSDEFILRISGIL